MGVTVVITENGTADDLRSLRSWLLDTDSLRGRVDLVERPPDPGQLGPALEALVVILGPGGAATALSAALLSWIRHRTSDLQLKLTQENGRSVELSARRVRALNADALRTQIEQLTRTLDSGSSAGNTRPQLEPGELSVATAITALAAEPD